MSSIPLDVDEARLIELCRQRWAESQTLDFKRELPAAGTDAGKREVLKDVCAMANADGGDLVYGIDEASGAADKIVAIAGESADAAKRRLSQIVDAGIEPRIAGLHFQDISVAGGYVLLVRVPASFDGPHCYKINDARRFVMRNGTYIQDMTYGQLRTAFDRTATLAEQASRFRSERIIKIKSGITRKPLIPGPQAMVNVTPISAMSRSRSLDIQALYQHPKYTEFMFPGWGGGVSRAMNLDGLVIYSETGEHQHLMRSHTLVFRIGALEALKCWDVQQDPSGSRRIPGVAVTVFYRSAIELLLKHARELGFSGPAFVGIALLSVGGYEFGASLEHFDPSRADREDLILPEAWVPELADAPDIDEIARPLFDMLWQAFDVERCYAYNDKGAWQPGQ